MVCGADLPDAMAAFDGRLKEALVVPGDGGDAPAGEGSGLKSARSSATGAAPNAAGGSTEGGKPMAAVLAHAFKRLQERVGLLARAQSEPAPELAAAAAAAATGGCGGGLAPVRVGLPGGFQAASEPSTPMLGGGPDALPDSIRTISTAARRMSSEFRVPSVQAGLRPW